MFELEDDMRISVSVESGDAPRSPNSAIAGALFQQDWRKLVGFLRPRLSDNQQAAEDMAQEALARIAGASRRYSPERARGLLYSVARNLLVDNFRAERSRRAAAASVCILDDGLESPDALRTLVAREDLARVRQAIHDLPPRCRQVFVLSRFEHMSYAEIACRCQISNSMVEKHMNRALRRLVLALDGGTDDNVGPGEDE